MAQPVSMYLPTEPEGIEYLIELALDLRGTWEHAADELWGQFDPELWTLTLNPWPCCRLCRVSNCRWRPMQSSTCSSSRSISVSLTRTLSRSSCTPTPWTAALRSARG